MRSPRSTRVLVRLVPVAVVLALLQFGAVPSGPSHAAGKWTGNLIKNGSAEKTKGTPTDFTAVGLKHWKQKGQFTAAKYAAPVADPHAYGNRLAKNSPGPGRRGGNYFTGGYHTTSATKGKAIQVVDLTRHRGKVRAGAKAKLTGWLGGYASNEDAMKVKLVWQNARGKKVGKSMVLKPVTRLDRDPTPPEVGEEYTLLAQRKDTAKVPKAAHRAKVIVKPKKGESGIRAAYADKLSLKLRKR